MRSTFHKGPRITTAVAMATGTGSVTAVSFFEAASGETNESSSNGSFVAMITPVTALLLLYSREVVMFLSCSARASAHSTALILLQHSLLSDLLRHSGQS